MIDDSMQHNLPIPSNSDNPASVSPQQNDPNIQKPSSNPNDTKNNQNDSNSEEEENSNVIDNYDYENYDEVNSMTPVKYSYFRGGHIDRESKDKNAIYLS